MRFHTPSVEKKRERPARLAHLSLEQREFYRNWRQTVRRLQSPQAWRGEWPKAFPDRTALASHDTVSELLRVLAYPKFKLTRDEQETLLADFLPDVETVKIDTTPDGLPDIRDADDTIFLVLATVGCADALVSGDGDLQAVRDQLHLPILTLAEFADWLQSSLMTGVEKTNQSRCISLNVEQAWRGCSILCG